MYEPNYQKTDRIGLSEVIFENDPKIDCVTIEGFLFNETKNEYIPTSFSCDFQILTDLLNLDYETSEKLIQTISEAISNETSEEPIRIKIEKIYGSYILIKDIELIFYRPFTQNENGEWHEVPKNEEFYLIDKVHHSWEVRNAPLMEFQQQLDKQFKILKLAYEYFNRLLKNNFNEKQARKQSGLDNELLFRIAHLHYKIKEYIIK